MPASRRTRLLFNRSAKLIAKFYQCQPTALAAAVLLALTSSPAAALSLGRITVQSALGEPLHAEVDFLDINAEEASSLNARVAAPEAFKAAGLEYNAALGNLKTSLQRRANGRAFLKLSSDRVVNEPFVDLILETTWNSGRIVRDYTMLFDPPNLRSAANGAAPDKAQLPIQSTASVSAAPARSAIAAGKPAAAKPIAVAQTRPPVTKPLAPVDSTVRVKPGQTAGQIAEAHKPASVSLDQMLVAMLHGNPEAFIHDNVNRLKAGAIVTMPTAEQAQAIPADEATQTVIAQSRDFNDFRQRLADNAPQTQTAPADRAASGKVQATVQDKTSAATAPDKLTLSKGAVQGKSGEDQLAKAGNAEQARARAAEVAKNITDLKTLAAAASTPEIAATPAPSASAAVAQEAAPIQASTAPAPTVVALPAPVPAPVASQPAAKVAEPVAGPSFIDTLLENPLLPGGVVALLGLLGGLAFFKSRRRKQDTLLDSTFAESSLADAFSGASGGQNVDTEDSLTTGSSMVYSPSQLDAADDVDPVAEADVYLAYGRDLQAEEILKDALRSTPQRVAIHVKLAEIYAKRRDVKALEASAALAFNLTDGKGAEWEQICEKGLPIDPDNALYLPGGQPGSARPATPATGAGDDTAALGNAAELAELDSGTGTELDLDLDFSLEEPEFLKTPAGQPMLVEPPADEPRPTIIDSRLTDEAAHTEPAEPAEPITMPGSLDFTEPQPIDEASQPATLTAEFPESESELGAEFMNDLAESQTPQASDPDPLAQDDPLAEDEPLWPQAAPKPDALEEAAALALPEVPAAPETPEAPELSLAPNDEAAPTAANKEDLLSFNLDSISLDLDEDRLTMPGELAEPVMDALETKLALAEEFRAIGDDDGARALIEEVIAEASGEVKSKAQQALNKL